MPGRSPSPPPLANLRPGPHNPHWLVLEYYHAWEGNCLYIVVVTDVPCHLTLHWTAEEEKMHLRVKDVRGLTVLGNPKYCFVEYTDVDEADPGDHLYHSFVFCDFNPGECRWWYFSGTIGGVDTASNSPIFTACYGEQGDAMDLKHTSLLEKEVGGVIDHADGSITPAKLSWTPGDYDPLDPFLELVGFFDCLNWVTSIAAGGSISHCVNQVQMIAKNGWTCLRPVYPWYQLLQSGGVIKAQWPIYRFTHIFQQEVYLMLTDTSSLPPSPTSKHIGFYISGGVIYASSSDGATQEITNTGQTHSTGYMRRRLDAVLTEGVDCKFYVDGVLVATHTTYLPAGPLDLYLSLNIRSQDATLRYMTPGRFLVQASW